MKIELQKVECDWPQSSLGCYISLNNYLVDVITPINNPHAINTVELTKSGVLRLVIRDMGRSDGHLGSVSFPLSLLNCNTSTITLPLFDSPNGDTINSISDVFESPNLTLSYYNNYSNNEIFLDTKESESNFKTVSMLDPRASISLEEDDLQIKTSILNNYEEKKTESLKIFHQEIENLRDELSKEKEKSKSIDEKFQDLMQNYKNTSARSQTRENSLLELISEKETQLTKNIEINLSLENKLRTLEYENKLMLSKVEKYEKQEEYVIQLENELKKYQELLTTTEKAKDELTNTLIQLGKSDFPSLPISIPTAKQASSRFPSTPKVLSENFSSKPPCHHTEGQTLSKMPKAHPKSMTPSKIHKIKDSGYSFSAFHTTLTPSNSSISVKAQSSPMPPQKHLKSQNAKSTPSDENNSKPFKNHLKPTKSSQSHPKAQSKPQTPSTQSLSYKKP